MKPKAIPEQIIEPFDPSLIYDFQSYSQLEASMNSLADQGIAYGNTNGTTTIRENKNLTLEQRHQRFYQRIFATCIRLAYGLEDRIDTAKYVAQTIEPIIGQSLGASLQFAASIDQSSSHPRSAGDLI